MKVFFPFSFFLILAQNSIIYNEIMLFTTDQKMIAAGLFNSVTSGRSKCVKDDGSF